MSSPVITDQPAQVRRLHGQQLPPVALPDSAIEALKWIALVLMIGDHANAMLLDRAYPWLFNAGRLVMPLFGFVLAYNLARPSSNKPDQYRRVATRIAVFALIAEGPFMLARYPTLWQNWFPINILFTLAVAVTVIAQLDKHRSSAAWLAFAIFLIGGSVPEFWWPGIACVVTAWRYCKNPTASRFLQWVAAVASLAIINMNLWAMAVFICILPARFVRARIPRMKWFFYAFYPLHLLAIWLINLATHHQP